MMKSHRVLAAVAVACAYVGCVDEQMAAPEGEPSDHGAPDIIEAASPIAGPLTDGEVIADVAYQDTQLLFIALPDEETGPTVGVLERGPDTGYRLDLEPALANANPREIFHAVTSEGTDEPPLLTDLYPAPTLGLRGWYLDAIDNGALRATQSSCNASTFDSAFQNFQSIINDGVYTDTNTSPPGPRWSNSDPFAAGGCAYSGYPCLYEWSRNDDYYTYYNIDRFKTRVHICNLQYRTTICHQGNCYSDVGPYITFFLRRGNNSSTAIAFSDDVDSATSENSYWSWYWHGSSSGGTAANYDWRTDVDWAWNQDEFMIGVAYEHEGW